MKVKTDFAIEMASEPKAEPKNEPKTKIEIPRKDDFSPVSLDKLIANDRIMTTLDDVKKAVTFCDVIEPEELESAVKHRYEDYIRNGEGMSVSEFYSRNPLSLYVSKKAKRKRHIYEPYAENPIENALYDVAFTWSIFAMKKTLEWSNFDTRLIPTYCNLLANCKFGSHSDAVKEIVQECLTTTLGGMREIAMKKWSEIQFGKTDYNFVFTEEEQTKEEFEDIADEYEFVTADITNVCKNKSGKFRLFEVTILAKNYDDESKVKVSFEIDMANEYALYRQGLRAVSAFISTNKSQYNGYDKHKKKGEIDFDSEVISNTYADYKAEQELVRVEGSQEWIKRRTDVLNAVGKCHSASDLIAYTVVLDLMHNGIIPLSDGDRLTEWQIKQVCESIGKDRNPKVKQFVRYVKVGNTNKFEGVNDAHLEYKSAKDDEGKCAKCIIDLGFVRNSLKAYLKAFAE